MEPEQKTNGALIGSIIIILILIVGGIYLWKTSREEAPMPANQEVGTSDTSADMEASVDDIDLESLDSGI